MDSLGISNPAQISNVLAESKKPKLVSKIQ
jgi:hypothetical protein